MINSNALLNSASIISLNVNENKSFLIGFGGYKKFNNFSALDRTKPAFYINNFFLSSSAPWIQYEQSFELTPLQIEEILGGESSIAPISWQIDQEQQTLFHQTFIDLQQAFQENKLKKAVPYIFAHSFEKMTRIRLISLLKAALFSAQTYPGYLYGHWEGDQGFIGLTPELLFDYQQAQPFMLKTMALAGTKKHEEENELLTHNEKELKEHRFVVEGIKQALNPLGQAIIGSTGLLNLPNLKHLLTPIEVQLHQPFNFEKAVECLHPTPALGAFPREEGRAWLARYQEKIDRQSYGAPFGVYNPFKESSCCLVGIRQVQWHPQGMRIGAGCGIVAESSLEREWAEIQLKLQAIRNLLGL